MDLNPFDLKKEFQLQKENLFSFIKEKASQNKIDYFLADLNDGFNQMLKSYLIKRSKLY